MRRLVLAALVALAPLPALAAERFTVLLDWFVNPDHAPLILAEARGEFARRGLEVTLVPPADPAAPPRLVAAGEADLAITYQPSLYTQVAEGLPVMRVATLVPQPLNALVVLDDGKVARLADLRGRTVGFSVGGFEDALLARMLESEGLTLADVTLVNVNFALTAALLSGRVDAVIGAFRNFELTQIALEGRNGRAFLPEAHGVPPYDELVLIARADRADEPAVARFVEAVAAAAAWAKADPAAAEAAFFAAAPDIDDPLNRTAFRDTLPLFADDPGRLDTARYETFARFMTEAGLVKNLPPLASYARALP